MDKAEIAQTVSAELQAATGRLGSALNNLTGAYGKQYRSCVVDLCFASVHLAAALLASRGLRARSHEAAQELLALHFVRAGALPADTSRKLNALMDRRHTADYKPVIPVDADDVAEFRPWVCAFARAGLKLIAKSARAGEAAALEKLVKVLEQA
jgi:uncharacterized protein (UPF0332 family)